MSQHSKALQALGLQDSSPAKAAQGQDDQPAEATAEAADANQHHASVPQTTGNKPEAAGKEKLLHHRTDHALQKGFSVPQSPFKSDVGNQQQQHQLQQPQEQKLLQHQQPPLQRLQQAQHQQPQQHDRVASGAETVPAAINDAAVTLPPGPVQRLETASSDLSLAPFGAKASPRHHRCTV